ncbi:hypothetical protein [Alkalihalobacterium elongatum]|nr:hypothetical protein [Alkalihalobacterium elongatum]
MAWVIGIGIGILTIIWLAMKSPLMRTRAKAFVPILKHSKEI